MLTLLLTVVALLAGADTARAQQCLHSGLETVDERIRRERAVDFARRLNAAEQMALPRGPRYRSLDQLPGLPPVPDGFDLQFHTDGRTYAFSLKDRRDPCRFAVFSDQEGAVYAAAPQPQRATILPLETR